MSTFRPIPDPMARPAPDGAPSNAGWVAYWAIAFILLAASYCHAVGRVGESLQPLLLSQENNVAAWWSGMALFAGCVVAVSVAIPLWARDRRAALGFAGVALLMFGLTLDEVGSLHERAGLIVNALFALDVSIHKALLLPAAVGGAVLVASLAALWSRRAAFPRAAVTIGLAFVLFGSVYGQEVVEHFLTWPDSLLGVRLVIEEGTELVAMALVLWAVVRAGRSLGRGRMERLRDVSAALGVVTIAAVVAAAPLLLMGRTVGDEGFRPNWGNFTTVPLTMLLAAAGWACAVRARRAEPLRARWLVPAALLVFLSAQSVALLVGGRFLETAATGAIRTATFGVPLAAVVLLAVGERAWRRLVMLAVAALLAVGAGVVPKETLALALAILAGGALAAAVIDLRGSTAPRPA